MNYAQYIQKSEPFVRWMLDWQSQLPSVSLQSLIGEHPEHVGIVCVDIIEGFCSVGPLSSPRVDALVAPIVRVFESAWAAGVRDIALTQDTHPADAVEFANYAPHCMRGTLESQTAAAIKALPFYNQMTIHEKNSINSGVNASFADWFRARPHIRTWIVLGDCTDICTFQLATYIRTYTYEHQMAGVRVIAPVDCIDTYDLPVSVAQEIGATPHDADFLHPVFLYAMHLNGVEVISTLAP
jgi:nicotinamidase-related amidase